MVQGTRNSFHEPVAVLKLMPRPFSCIYNYDKIEESWLPRIGPKHVKWDPANREWRRNLNKATLK